MKVDAVALVLTTFSSLGLAALHEPRKAPLAQDTSVSLKSRNLFARSYDYCSDATSYCTDSTCCGTSAYTCMSAGDECCASLSAYGYGLYCSPGTHCIVQNSKVMCQDSTGGYLDGSSTGQTRKKKSKAWIAGAVAGPLIGLAVIAAALFFFCVVKKKKNKPTQPAYAAVNNPSNTMPMNNGNTYNNNAGAPPMQNFGNQPVPMAQQTTEYKSPVYVQQNEVPSPAATPAPQYQHPAPAPSVSPMMGIASPTPLPYGQNLVSPMSTGNATPYQQPVYQAQAPRNGAHEVQ